VLGNLSLAQEEARTGQPTHDSLAQIQRAALRARALVQRISAFGRADAPALSPQPLQPIVDEVLALVRVAMPAGVTLRTAFEALPGPVLADATQLHQVLMNLCVNAAHAMKERGGVLTVRLGGEDLTAEDKAAWEDVGPGRYCKLTVSDTGHGMERSVMERIFDPYFTTKGPGEGTGLGLAVVHGIVKGHDGAIRVESEPGRGATFEVLLPTIHHETGAEPLPGTREIPGGTERVLFVDDEEPLALTGKGMLEALGYRVSATTSSREALEIFRSRPDQFDLVITDMTMPHMTGSELAGHVLKIRADIPVILCTGYSDLITPEKAKDMGIREFVTKPLPLQDLADTIRIVLGPP
jgi:CheY-like chemotaxis protein